ncbi:MAG: hypothetical protein GY842_23890 [bacterium]|nr:hypothetical protein [bacterium]
MAKMFYSVQETCDKLSMSEDQIKDLVRQAKLREFRDAGKSNYKVEEVDALAGELSLDPSAQSGSGELVLEPAEESTIDVKMGSTGDMMSLEEADLDDTAAGQEGEEAKKNGTVVTSVGISVFDEAEEIDGLADPLAQTVVSGASAGGLGIEGVGSGSGLLDLTRESDDTSLGAELLDEIYPGDEDEAAPDMGDSTRAGLEGVLPDAPEGDEILAGTGVAAASEDEAESAAPSVTAVTRFEFSPDAVSAALTGLLLVAMAVLGFAGLAVAASLRGGSLPVVDFVFGKLWMFGLGALVVTGIAGAVGFVLGKRATS